MKREINLRTREFAIAREFYWPRVFATLLAVLLVAALLGGSLLLYLYRMSLHTALADLERQKRELELKTPPLLALEGEIEAVKERLSLDRSLAPDRLPWSSYLRSLRRAAAEGGIAVNSASCFDGSSLNIRGEGPSLQEIVLFVQALEREDFIAGAGHTVMNKRQGDTFSFDMVATLRRGSD